MFIIFNFYDVKFTIKKKNDVTGFDHVVPENEKSGLLGAGCVWYSYQLI